MNELVNKGTRRLGIPGRPAIILNPGESVPMTKEKLEEISQNKTAKHWLHTGVLEYTGKPEKKPMVKPEKTVRSATTRPVERDQRKDEPLPEGLTGEGVEIFTKGGGWYQVYVNGFKVTDRNVRKDEAEKIASDYEAE